jgi:CHAP domain-containing protein
VPGPAGTARPVPHAPNRSDTRSGRARRRRRLATVLIVAVGALAIVGITMATSSSGGPSPSSLGARIVTAAQSQLGYRTDPPDSYCNKFSAYWDAGTATCTSGLRSEEWCADFAAWTWKQAGADFTYELAPGDINAASASFYVWAVDHGTWHPAGAGYTPQPGDVAVYGLDTATDTAAHVAVVTGYTPGARGPDVVNGDGDRTAFSVVETGTDQYRADTHGGGSPLSGYASPLTPAG